MSEAQAFERAVFENPDDVAGWCAFADFLADRDDPRGEFMQVQLALEDGSRSKEERDALHAREAELLAAHEREWLGELAPHFQHTDDNRPRVEHWWARGYLTEVRAEYLTLALAQALAAAPAVRFLRKLHLETVQEVLPDEEPDPFAAHAPTPEHAARHEAHFELIGAPWLAGLRELQVGESTDHGDAPATEVGTYAPGLEHLIAGMPRVEELHLLCAGYDARTLFALPNLSGLQVLRVVGLGDASQPGEDHAIPLWALARNAALANLTHLLVHPSGPGFLPLAQAHELVYSRHLSSLTHLQLRLSNMGDEGAAALVASGILKRLGWLDLRNGTMTDFAARTFADCAAAKELRRLDLSRNAVTPTGLSALRRAGVNAVANNTLSRREQEALDREVRNQPGTYNPDDDEERDGDWE